MKTTVYTIGHSTHPIEEFIAMLQSFGVKQLMDVRTVPKSRFNPQFNTEVLAASLKASHIAYQHVPALGGLRHPKKDSINSAWRNASFRGYADYMQTKEFADALRDLMERAKAKPIAIMCAEAVPWRCHRSLIADALIAHHVEVRDIMAVGKDNLHKLNPMARVSHGHVTYPPSQTDLFQ